ncbi:MAG: hypothetical protein NW226_17410 [Microscillaceae bacterium]|nr:hypothetical protein [Microscillaceae bacterium]
MTKQKPQWLEDIQHRSWEPELFISGGVIFFLLQVTDFLYYQSFIRLQQSGYYEYVFIANLLTAALYALIFGFSLHLIMRGFWVASITLSDVFPEGIQMNKIHYADIFKNRVSKVRDITDWVILQETICSLIFTLSFFFFMIIMGLLVALLVIIPHSSLRLSVGDSAYNFIWVISRIFALLGLVYMFDFLTLGYVKKQKKLAKLYYPVYLIFSILTLAPLYRTTYYTLVSNIKAWIVVAGAITYLIIAFSITQLTRSGADAIFNPKKYLNIRSQNTELDTRLYENLRPAEELVQQASIQSDIIEESYVKLFIVHQKIIENLMDKDCAIDRETEAEILDCYAEFYHILLDNQPLEKLRWRQFTHPKTKEMGIISYIPIREAIPGEHSLKIVLHVKSKQSLMKLHNFGLKGPEYSIIPFWKN